MKKKSQPIVSRPTFSYRSESSESVETTDQSEVEENVGGVRKWIKKKLHIEVQIS
jgi:hypothetical protein